MGDLIIETDIVCPVCEHREWVSPEDPDATLSEMHRHLARRHPERDSFALLADVYEVRRAARP